MPPVSESELKRLGERRSDARAALATATDALREAVRQAIADGMSEYAAARAAGVTRMTIRTWVGK